MPELIFFGVIAVTVALWFVPAIVAGRRRHPSQYAIMALLFFSLFLAFFGPFGWLAMAIAWIVAIVWSLTAVPARDRDPASA